MVFYQTSLENEPLMREPSFTLGPTSTYCWISWLKVIIPAITFSLKGFILFVNNQGFDCKWGWGGIGFCWECFYLCCNQRTFSHLLFKFLIMPHMHAGGRNYLLISQKRAFCVSRQIKVIPWQGRHKFSPAITSRSFASILSFVYSALSHLVCSAIYGILSARVSKGLEFWGSRLFTKLASVKLLDWWKNTTFLTNRFSRI